MSWGALAFLNPWLLGALAALPVIYWLLRTVPPRPRQITFPPTRILVGLENKEKTPAKSPWWLTLIRLLAAAAIIFALAEPVLNPSREAALEGNGPVAIVVDNGWSGASHWEARARMIDRVIAEAEGQGRAVVVRPHGERGQGSTARIEAPAEARSTAAAFEPQPFAPDRAAALKALQDALGPVTDVPSIVWLSDGIDHDGKAAEFAARSQGAGARGHVRGHRQRPRRGGARGVGRHRRERQARSARAARGRASATRLRARLLGARPAARRGAVHAGDRRPVADNSPRAAARVAQPGRPRRDRRRALGRRREPARCTLAMAPRGADLRREPRAGAAAAGPALLHREGADAVLGAGAAQGLEPHRRHQRRVRAERQRAGAGRHRHAVGRGEEEGRGLGEARRRARALCRAAARERRRRHAAAGSAARRRAHARRRAVVVDAAAARIDRGHEPVRRPRCAQGSHRQPPGARRPGDARPRRAGVGAPAGRHAARHRTQDRRGRDRALPRHRQLRLVEPAAVGPVRGDAAPHLRARNRRRRRRRGNERGRRREHGRARAADRAAAAADARRLRHPEAAADDGAAGAGRQGARPRARASIIRRAIMAPAAPRAPSTC